MILNSDTGKFWSFRDTKNYKHQKIKTQKDDVFRTFVFEKSFLLQIELKGKTEYVVPIRYMGKFPHGFYIGTGANNILLHFHDSDIKEVL